MQMNMTIPNTTPNKWKTRNKPITTGNYLPGEGGAVGATKPTGAWVGAENEMYGFVSEKHFKCKQRN